MGMDAATVARWEERFEQLTDAIGPCFKRQDLRRQALGYLQDLLGRVERKSSWQLSEYLGRDRSYGIQRLLGRASWDAEQVRDVLLAYARRHLLSKDEPGVLVIDQTGFLKKGRKSVGVQRQYSGTAGRIENCQIGVFLALVGTRGRTLPDRELYLPESCCRDRTRCEEAGVPGEVSFAIKTPPAQLIIIGESMRNCNTSSLSRSVGQACGTGFQPVKTRAGSPCHMFFNGLPDRYTALVT